MVWTPFRPLAHHWNLQLSSAEAFSPRSDELKCQHELRLLNLLLPAYLDVAPDAVFKRESPDFEVATARGRLFVEVVDAVPEAVSASGTMNLAKRRSREDLTPYHVNGGQFGRTVASEIAGKRLKAREWMLKEPALAEGLVLLVNGGQGALWLRHYFRDHLALGREVMLNVIEPFAAVVLGDETGAFVWSVP